MLSCGPKMTKDELRTGELKVESRNFGFRRSALTRSHGPPIFGASIPVRLGVCRGRREDAGVLFGVEKTKMK